eukprot:6289150-Pyramimonas_sp.AAC.1
MREYEKSHCYRTANCTDTVRESTFTSAFTSSITHAGCVNPVSDSAWPRDTVTMGRLLSA